MNDRPFGILHINNEKFPKKLVDRLKNKCPNTIYYKGNINLLDKKAVGFCGSRHATGIGLEVARDCSEQIIERNCIVVSGNATGVDFTTHYEALKNGGSTILVLPEGINNFRIKKELENVWDWDRVLVLSQFHPDNIWRSYQAMQRNSVIIGLSDAMIVIEAGEKGGTIEAGKTSLALGCPTYVVEYKDIDRIAPGNKFLIKRGAVALKKSRTTMRANISQIFETANFIKKNEQLGLDL